MNLVISSIWIQIYDDLNLRMYYMRALKVVFIIALPNPVKLTLLLLLSLQTLRTLSWLFLRVLLRRQSPTQIDSRWRKSLEIGITMTERFSWVCILWGYPVTWPERCSRWDMLPNIGRVSPIADGLRLQRQVALRSVSFIPSCVIYGCFTAMEAFPFPWNFFIISSAISSQDRTSRAIRNRLLRLTRLSCRMLVTFISLPYLTYLCCGSELQVSLIHYISNDFIHPSRLPCWYIWSLMLDSLWFDD